MGTLKLMADELLRESRRYGAKVGFYSFGGAIFLVLPGGDLPKISIIDAGMDKKGEILPCINNNWRDLISHC